MDVPLECTSRIYQKIAAHFIRHGKEELAEKINTALKELKEDGTYDALVKKYSYRYAFLSGLNYILEIGYYCIKQSKEKQTCSDGGN